jgi:hypothetical protein
MINLQITASTKDGLVVVAEGNVCGGRATVECNCASYVNTCGGGGEFGIACVIQSKAPPLHQQSCFA